MTTAHHTAARREPLDRPRRVHQVLILLAVALFGGDSTLSERVDDVLDDRPGAEQAMATAEQIDAAVARSTALLVESRGALLGVLKRHDSTATELRAVLEQGAEAAESLQSEVIELRFELREQLDADEWTELFEADVDD